VALVLGGLAVPAYGQDKLEWKLKEGDKLFFENVSNMKQTVEVNGMEQKQEMSNTMVARLTVKKKTKDDMVLEMKIEKVKGKGSGGLEEMTKIIEQMKGAELTITLDKNNKVTKFAGYEDLIKKIAKEDKKAGTMFQAIFSKETAKRHLEELFTFLPAKAVTKGDTWKRTETMPLGPVGTLKLANQFTYLGKTKDGAKIGLTGTATYTPPKGDQEGAPFKITKGDLKAEKIKGTYLFDPTRGRLVKIEQNLRLKGKLTVEVMGQTIEMEMTQDATGTVRVLDKAPADD
jgi:hypothetical protein